MIKDRRVFIRAAANLCRIVVADDKPQKTVSMGKCLRCGALFVDEDYKPLEEVDKSLFDFFVSEYADESKWNQQFHKSWAKVSDANIEQLLAEQMMHYFSTYGLEALGLSPIPYIPLETVFELDKKSDETPRLHMIRVVSEETAVSVINEYFRKTLKPGYFDLIDIGVILRYATVSIDEISSFELKCIYYKHKGVIPEDPQLFLRYIVYLFTNNPLLIKNSLTINSIRFFYASVEQKKNGNTDIPDIVHNALKKADPVELSTIFLRYKPLFLALKADKRNAPIINKIRRLAKVHHKPLSEISVANITVLLSQKRYDVVSMLLSKTSVRNLIKLINFSNNTSDNHIYNIRNGKVFVTTKPVSKVDYIYLHTKATEELSRRMLGKLNGRKYFIPEGIDYRIPASEKQMLGNMPYGSTVTADINDNALCVSIAWKNFKNVRTDIDLHLVSATRQFGWNSSYRSDGTDEILYSGDMTDATNGATESFRCNVSADEVFLVSASLFNGEDKCPFTFFISGADNFRENAYGMVDISKAVTLPVKLEFNGTRNFSFGYLKGKAFTFYGGQLGYGLVPNKDFNRVALTAVTDRCEAMLPLETLITMGGGQIVRENETGAVDLSPENIRAQDIFDILDN